MLDQYSELQREVDSLFRGEYQDNDNSLDGLEDFYMLRSIVRKNSQCVAGALRSLQRMTDVSGFDVTQEPVDKELQEILKD